MAQTETQATEFGTDTVAPPRAGVRGRILLIGALATAAVAFLVTQAEMVLSSLRIGYLQFPPAALGLLLALVAVSRALRRLSARWGLSSSDLLIIYSMMLVGAMTSSHGIVQKWIPLPVALLYYADPINNWLGLYRAHLPAWLFPSMPHAAGKDPAALWYYERLPRGASVPWGAWVVPVLGTGIIVVLVVFAFLCLAAILRRQWVDNEKLSFPLAQLPLEIAGDEERRTFFSNRLMWLGALLPIAVYGVKGLHQVQPTVPDITLQWNLSDYVTVPPWNAGASETMFILSFAAIGFFFLLPADVLFSIWFFFLLTRIEQVFAASYNMDMPGMPIYPPPLFIGYQTVGAYLVLTAYFFWLARPHLKKVWAAAIGKERVDDSQEILPYRVAVWGLLGCIVLSAVWLWAIGMSPWLALLELLVFLFVTAVVMARTTAEAGMLMTETTFRPIDLYRMFAGSSGIHGLGPSNLAALAFFDNLFLRDQRGLLLTGFLDAGRLADGTSVRRRSFAGVLILGVLIALVVAGGLNISLPYHLGANTMYDWMEHGSPTQTLVDYQPYFNPNPPSQATQAWQMPLFFTVGVVMTLFLTAMRANFFWWPLHPLGYAIAGSWSTVEFWFACLIAWAFKTVFLRYGGMSLYQRARPFFLGMVLGEFGMAVFYVLLNILTAWLTPQHKFPPPAFPWG
ncbi:MAG: hypothetical protein JO250_17655 [Armatimonadetes bacterium]|nr:hypothetical protein [Armatimonadota bacterium]